MKLGKGHGSKVQEFSDNDTRLGVDKLQPKGEMCPMKEFIVACSVLRMLLKTRPFINFYFLIHGIESLF
jgi:hypothetical protein